LIERASKPAESVGTAKQVIPRAPSSLVRAKSSAVEAQVPSVMKNYDPLITHSTPSRSARVVRQPGSDPDPGSVSA
jgi:hypothetical protein